MHSIYIFFVIGFLTVIFTFSTSAQQPDKILFGTYLPSSDYPEITYHQFNDTNLVKLGFNTIFQTVMHPIIHARLFDSLSAYWMDNRVALANSSFDNIVSMNGYWNRADDSLLQVDWIKILTHSIYNIWEAEGKGDFNSNSLVMERNSLITNEFSDGTVKGVKVFSGLDSNSTEQEIFAIRGPSVYQDRSYKVTHRLAAEPIPYKVYFRMRVGNKPEENVPVCSLKVWVSYFDANSTHYTTLLASQFIHSGNLSDSLYNEISLTYNLDNLPVQLTDSTSGHFPTQNFGYRKVDYTTTKVFYEVTIPQGVDLGILEGLFIDYMKVTDGDIWEIHGDENIPVQLARYHQIWSSTDVNDLYKDKMKFFYTLDEPHAYDRFRPYGLVESYMNNMSQFNNKFMLTKIYPEWSGEKEGLNVIRTWNSIVKPKKTMFWYYTVFNDNPGTILTHSQLRTRLQEVNEKYDDFYYTAQTFGARKLSSIGNPNPTNADYHYYRTPTGSEALGQTTQALAYGCKGIFYETYYSYQSWYTDWYSYFAEGLVGENLTQYNVPRVNDFGLYDTIKSIGKRLKGTLGKHLVELQYTKNDACIAYHRDSYPLPYKDTASISEFAIFDDNLPDYPVETHYFNVGFTKFKPKQTSSLKGDYYFLLNINSWNIAEPDSEVFLPTYNKIKFGIKVDNLKNWHFYDIEGGGNYYFINLPSTTGYDFVDSVAIGLGDGRLYRLIPTVGSSGPLLEDEIILTGDVLSSEGTITVPDGVTLQIEGNYTLTDSLIIEDGGVLALEPGSTLNLDSASSVYCAGDLYINGTETNKVTINFLQPNESKQNSIYLGRESSAIINYAQIKNGYSGISATNGFDTLIIDNCNFTNISHAALLLNGAGYDKPLITNNTYSNCDFAGFFSNLSTVIVNSDSANTRSGYYFSGVSDLWFGNNKLTGTQEGVGLTLTGCFGNIYNNKITNHTDGILLANSFPKSGGNEITNNTQRGLVCEYGSTPDLELFSEVGTCEQMNTYPLSGFNTIHDNGGEGSDEMNAEIFLDNSSINMCGGTNAVIDDGSEAIIAGKSTDDPLDLSGNYWGETGFESLTFNLNSVVIYQPEVTTFSPIVSTDCPFVINLSTLSFTDTLHRISNAVPGTGGERAEGYMAEGEYDSAYSEFQSMSLITEDTTSINTEPLRGMYRSGKLGNNKETKLYLLTLKTDSLLSSVTDTNALKTLNRLKVYIEADNNNIPAAQLLASQNTTNAITTTDQYHAQTEELTIALRGTTLNRNMKNDVGSLTTMNKTGMNNLMKRHGNKFTIKKEPKPVEIITEYSLSQNYPNPFNSSTIIEFALPKDGLVSIKLYDITGRLVKQLVNEQKPSGRHKTTIESGNLASGVYIYSLRVNDININKKLVILK